MRKLVCLLLFALVLSLGCIGNNNGITNNLIQGSTDKYLEQSMTVTRIEDNPKAALAKEGSCYLLICQNQTKTGFTGWLKKYFYYSLRFGEFFDPSLIGGSCWLQNVTQENREEILKNWSENVYYPREVGIGQGMTFADFNQANLYCNNSLRYSLKLVRTMGSPSYLFSPKAYAGAACFLDKSVIPIYILYNNGTAPSGIDDNSGLFASQMNGVGPVMIASELNPSNDSTNLVNIESQISGMKSKCPNCLIGASVTLNDISVLKKLKDDNVLDKIDFVGFGLDSNYMDGKCGDALSLLIEAEALSEFVRKNYEKPTFWYYVNFNRAQCRWTDYEERKLYSAMFKGIDTMHFSGLMGMAPVPFYDNAFFYPNSNNSFLNSNNELRQDASSVWFSFCRQYYGNQNFQIMSLDTSDMYTACKKNLVDLPTQKAQYFGNMGDFVPLENIDTENGKEPPMYQCKACFLAFDTGETPSFITKLKVNFEGSKCDSNSEDMEFYADLYDIDANLLRSFAAAESRFDHCAISSPYVSETTARSKCTHAVILKNDISSAATAEGCDVNAMPNPPYDQNNPNAKYSICALGMMQTATLPGDMYGKAAYNDLDMPPDVKACGGVNFNPFNSTHSICAASYRIVSMYMPAAYSAVSTNKNIFVVPGSANPDEDNSNLQDALVVLFTAAGYHGDGTDLFVKNYTNYIANFNGVAEKECNAMNQMGRELCCTRNQDGELEHNDDPYDVCGTKLDALMFYYNVRNKYPAMRYSLDVLGRYISAIDECGGCTKEDWFKSTCAKIRIYAPNANCQ